MDLSGVDDGDSVVEQVAGIAEKRAEYYFDEDVDVETSGDQIEITLPGPLEDERLFEGKGYFEFQEPVIDDSGKVMCEGGSSPSRTVSPSEITVSEAGGEQMLVCGASSDLVALQPAEGTSPGGAVAVLSGEFISRDQVEELDVRTSDFTGPGVTIVFNGEGQWMFQEITNRLVGYPIAIMMDGTLLTAPTVSAVIDTGATVITGSSGDEARLIAAILKYGELPAPVTIVDDGSGGNSQ